MVEHLETKRTPQNNTRGTHTWSKPVRARVYTHAHLCTHVHTHTHPGPLVPEPVLSYAALRNQERARAEEGLSPRDRSQRSLQAGGDTPHARRWVGG